MKIKCKDMAYEDVLNIKPSKHILPRKTSIFFRTLLKVVSTSDLKATNFKSEKVGMEKLGKKEPALYLMNHSSFIDLKIASVELYPKPFNIVCTSDGFVGKDWLMRHLGCIPTNKFVSDITLLHDMEHCFKKLKSSVLMYPEASYSFDGTATPLPESIGACIKKLGVPVIMIRTYGAFQRDPLYNMLQLRDIDVSAKFEYLLSPEDIKNMSSEEINSALKEQFTFDHFKWQKENNVIIDEPFRADGLNRVLYKCPVCGFEGEMEGKGTSVVCHHCNKKWELAEDGSLVGDGDSSFDSVPDWFKWEREQVKEELLNGTYNLNVPVDIKVLVDTKCLYSVGEGVLTHTKEGFHLTGCDGKLNYTQSPIASYSLYSDYHWYEIGDMICIGNNKILYYCFPKVKCDIAAKTRLAVEELYKIEKAARKRTKKS